MISNWKKTQLVDVVSILGDGLHGTPKYDKNGEYYFINGNNLSNGKIVFKDDTKRVSHTEYEKYKKNLNDRTVLVSINGTLGNVALYNGEKCILGKSACYFNVKDEVDKQFIKYVVNTRDFKEYISRFANGTTIKNVSLKVMRNYEFLLPQITEQQAIGATLSSIDNKIELNNAINKNLEEMAQALFKRWFVDFQFPNENGEPYKSGGGEFEESELGLIPRGWQVDKIENYTKLVSRGIAPKYDDSSDKRVINQKCIRDGLLNKSLARRHNSKVNDDKQVQFGDILVNSTGVGTLGRVTQVYEQLINYTVDSHVTIIRPNLVNGIGYMGCLLKGMQLNFEHAATGSTGQTELGREVIKQMKIVIPDNNIVKQFSDIYHSIFEQIIMNQENNSSLYQIRDTILPKLISGEIRVPLKEEYSRTYEMPLAAESKAQYSTT